MFLAGEHKASPVNCQGRGRKIDPDGAKTLELGALMETVQTKEAASVSPNGTVAPPTVFRVCVLTLF